MEIHVDVKLPGIESARGYAPFDTAKEKFEKNGYKIISLRENANLRMQLGRHHYISSNANRTRENVIYDKQRGIYLTKNPPIMQNPKEATNAHRNGNEYFLTEEQVEQALTDSVRISEEDIPTNRFDEFEITNFVFGDIAKNYGLFLLREAEIKEMPIWLADHLADKPFARPIWFRSLIDGSVIYGNGEDLSLNDDSRMRGIKIFPEHLERHLDTIVQSKESYL